MGQAASPKVLGPQFLSFRGKQVPNTWNVSTSWAPPPAFALLALPGPIQALTRGTVQGLNRLFPLLSKQRTHSTSNPAHSRPRALARSYARSTAVCPHLLFHALTDHPKEANRSQTRAPRVGRAVRLRGTELTLALSPSYPDLPERSGFLFTHTVHGCGTALVRDNAYLAPAWSDFGSPDNLGQ